MGNENRFLAKSHPQETIHEHTLLLKENFHKLKHCYPGLIIDWDILELAVLFHDIGKLNTKFQNKLYSLLNIDLLPDDFEDEEEIPHGNLSVAFLDRKKLQEIYDEETLKVLYQSIYYHHPRTIAEDKIQYLKDFIKKDLPKYIHSFPHDSPFFNQEPKANFYRYVGERVDYTSGRYLFYRYVMIKGLLNRLDYASSAHIDVETPNRDLEQKTLAFLKKFDGLRDIQAYMLEHQEENNVIVASTGIGKTESALLWISNHKGFFTLPLRVSINAIYKRIKYDDIGFEDAALLHSDALAYMIKNEASLDHLSLYTKARQFSQPLTITTVDQLFKFVFKQEGFEQVLATLAYSKVIIDEIQMYSPEIAACIIMGLKYITESGGKFSILTATFPKVLEFFLKELGLQYNYKEFILDRKRHKIRLIEEDIMDAMDEMIEMSKKAKVLVIVNTVRRAQELFAALGENENMRLLHSRFIKRDRNRLESEIMDFSDSSRVGIWVTTQVVEASLDIDFDFLFTELPTVDGLFQRMGRCFRKREFPNNHEQPNIIIFTKKPSGIGSIIDREIFQLSKEALIPFNNKMMSEKDKLAVVGDVFSLDKIKDTKYYKGIQDRLELLEYTPAYEFQRSEVEEKFRNIRSYTCIPQCVYNREQEKIQQVINRIKELGFSAKERLNRVKLLENINDLTVEVPIYFKEYFVDHIMLDKRNRIQLVKLDYNSLMGLIHQEEETNIL